ncbi:unnamed protein product [Phytophthora fragariaefolia]|uniref:Unnamed protein product n=1 Tax=Phytophthora fragariaefolia TaxID=1490495 RepID=A0A9W6WXS2_9STRA|nr:unnamed protein product [Phytophthora fragariaefolia]
MLLLHSTITSSTVGDLSSIGMIEEDNVQVVNLYAPHGWTGSPVYCEIVAGSIPYDHGNHINELYPFGVFNYPWVDDCIIISAKYWIIAQWHWLVYPLSRGRGDGSSH